MSLRQLIGALLALAAIALIAGCGSSRKVRASVVEVSVLDSAHIRWRYTSFPLDTASVAIIKKNL